MSLAPATNRYTSGTCAFNHTGWFNGSANPACNCNSSVFTTHTVYDLLDQYSSPACVLLCLPDLLTYPWLVGLPYVPRQAQSSVQATYPSSVTFTSATTLHTFMGETNEPLDGPFLPPFTQPVNDPTGVGLWGAEWIAELVAGLINVRLAATYSTWATYWNAAPLCKNRMALANNSNASIAAAFDNFITSVEQVSMDEYLGVLEIWVFGSVGFSSILTDPTAIPYLFPGIDPNLAVLDVNGPNAVALAISKLAAAINLNEPVVDLTTPDAFYNTLIQPVRVLSWIFVYFS